MKGFLESSLLCGANLFGIRVLNSFTYPRRKECHAEDNAPLSLSRKCIYGNKNVSPRFAIWGDSFAAEIAWELGGYLGRRGESLMHMSHSSKKVVLVGPLPRGSGPIPMQLARAIMAGKEPPFVTIDRTFFEKRNSKILEFLKTMGKESRVIFLDPSEVLCQGQVCQTQSKGHALYFDAAHLSLRGAKYLMPLFEKSLFPTPM